MAAGVQLPAPPGSVRGTGAGDGVVDDGTFGVGVGVNGDAGVVGAVGMRFRAGHLTAEKTQKKQRGQGMANPC